MNKYVTNLTLPNGTNILIKDSECRTDLSNEINRATKKETELEEADTHLRNDLTTETNARKQSDTALQQNINAEVSAREQGDNKNNAEIAKIHSNITDIENKNTEQDNEISTLRTMISTPYNFKGDVASISALPASGEVNDTYYVQDVKYKVTWTGSAWVQSSLSEADYQTELGELKGDLKHLFFETENLSKTVNINSLNFYNANYNYEVGKKYLVELKCEKTKGIITLSTADINNTVVEEDFVVLTKDLTSVLVEYTPSATFTKWQFWVNSDVDNRNVTLNVYEYGNIQNLTNERLSKIDYSMDKINHELGCIEKSITLNLDMNKGNLTSDNLYLKKDRLYHFKVTGEFTGGTFSLSTRKDTTLLEENFKIVSNNVKNFYFVPKYDSNVLLTYTSNSYVGDNPLSMNIDEIDLLSLNITFLSTSERLNVKEDCVVYDYSEKNLYIHKNGEWFKACTEKPYFSQEYEIGTNPVINKLSSDVSQIADPTVIRFNNAFYLFDTGDRIPIFKSFDMVNWRFYGYMMSEQDFNTVKTLTDNFLGTWAPDVIKIGNKWVCYVSLADSDYVNKCKVIAFTADRPDEEWTYKNIVVDNENNGVKECIDPDVFVENGTPYMFVGSFYNIYLFKLTSDGLTVDNSYSPKIVAKSGNVEGSYIYKKDGYYYLFLSNGTSDKDGNYKLKVARSASIDGIYYNKEGVAITDDGSLATTILVGNGETTFSVGHNGDIFTDKNGKYFIPFHGYTDKTNKRRLFIQEILWSEDGFPYFENEQCSIDFVIPIF